MISFDDTSIRIPLTQGKHAIVDFADADLMYQRWSCSTYGYAIRGKSRPEKGMYWMHRVILERMLNRPLEANEVCDHINNQTFDNRRCNLRLASTAENVRNSRMGKNNMSGYKGVHFHKGGKLWRAQITVNRKVFSLGYFKTPEAAALAYNEAASKYYGEFAKLNRV